MIGAMEAFDFSSRGEGTSELFVSGKAERVKGAGTDAGSGEHSREVALVARFDPLPARASPPLPRMSPEAEVLSSLARREGDGGGLRERSAVVRYSSVLSSAEAVDEPLRALNTVAATLTGAPASPVVSDLSLIHI